MTERGHHSGQERGDVGVGGPQPQHHLVPHVSPQPQVSAVHLLSEEHKHLEEGGASAIFHPLHSRFTNADNFLASASLSVYFTCHI